MTDQLVLLQLKQLPEELKKEVLDFIGYLFSKYQLLEKNKMIQGPLQRNKPAFGCGAVKVVMAPDFDAPLADFKEYMA